MSDDDARLNLSEVRPEDVRRSTRDAAELRQGIQTWLAGRLPDGAAPAVSEVTSPAANGLSSETLLFDASWEAGGQRETASLVARIEPSPSDVPVFPTYDLQGQFQLMRIVADRSGVPVPRARWLELDPRHLGAAFFVMDRAEGRVPPDVMPYTFGSWLSEASPEERRRLQEASVGILAELHGIDASSSDLSFLEFDLPGETALRRHFESLRRYAAWAKQGRDHPLLERAFRWLEDHWPAQEGESVISWGDARIGNVLYSGFEPAAVLDWEMAALGPRELDLGWMIFLHCFFDELARSMGKTGMPDFMRPTDVATHYEKVTGHTVHNLEFFQLYAALRQAIVMIRVHARRVHFGEAEWTENPDSVILHAATLERMLDGSWWTQE